MTHYALQLGASAGRGAYTEAIEPGQMIADCRRRLNQLFNGEGPEHFIFTLNCTDALEPGDQGADRSREEESRHLHGGDHNSILAAAHGAVGAGVVRADARASGSENRAGRSG